MPSLQATGPAHNPTFAIEPDPVFPPGTLFAVHVIDESYDTGGWTVCFPRVAYPEGLPTAQLAALTAQKWERAEHYMYQQRRTGQAWITATHPALRGEVDADSVGAAEMWEQLRELGVVAIETAA